VDGIQKGAVLQTVLLRGSGAGDAKYIMHTFYSLVLTSGALLHEETAPPRTSQFLEMIKIPFDVPFTCKPTNPEPTSPPPLLYPRARYPVARDSPNATELKLIKLPSPQPARPAPPTPPVKTTIKALGPSPPFPSVL